MRSIPYEIWYGGFAKHVLDSFVWAEEEDREQIAKHVYLRYTAIGREYHNAYHPWWIFTYAWENGIKLSISQQLAVLYHDVIYDINAEKGQNEIDSANLLRKDFEKIQHSLKYVEPAATIVEDTRLHFEPNPIFASEESALVLDLDIINMSLPYPQFMEWNDAVEREYSNMNPMDRLEFLRFFVSKKDIIKTDQLKDREWDIRRNLNRLIMEKEDQILDMPDDLYDFYNNNCN